MSENIMSENIMDQNNIWDECRDFPKGEVIKLANKIGPKRNAPVEKMQDALHILRHICFIATCLTEIEKDNPDLKDYDHNMVAQAVSEFTDMEDLPSHWNPGLFEPCCAAVRALRKGQIPWYRQEHYRWKQGSVGQRRSK